jgi:hypothetical protein
MNFTLYQQYLKEYVAEAQANSDGSARGVYERLAEIQVKGLFVKNKIERQRALADARNAFIEHRHWPVAIILKHLGV